MSLKKIFGKKPVKREKHIDYASLSNDELHGHTRRKVRNFVKSGSKEDYEKLDHHFLRARDKMRTNHESEMNDLHDAHHRKVSRLSGDTHMGPEHKNYASYRKAQNAHMVQVANVRKRHDNDHERLNQAHLDTIKHIKDGHKKLDHIDRHMKHHSVAKAIAKDIATKGSDKHRRKYNDMYGVSGPRPIGHSHPQRGFFNFHREDISEYNQGNLKGPATGKIDPYIPRKSRPGNNLHGKAGVTDPGNVGGKKNTIHSRAKAKQAAGG